MSSVVNKKGKKCTHKPVDSAHLEYADFIKKCHLNLRLDTIKMGADEAWKKHCADELLLSRYSNAMHKLSQFWDTNNKNEPSSCRISWTASTVSEYFQEFYSHEIIRERLLAKSFNLIWDVDKTTTCEPEYPFYLLDVGSCYNPFEKHFFFKVLPIDLAPATENVVKCDFLSVPLDKDLKIIENICQTLPLCTFHIVVFSLFLEYFPLPQQRYSCCEKAYNVLKPGGLLVIITPDSSHALYNSILMKNWKISLCNMGFWRIRYEKLTHIHCMVFRKCFSKQVPRHWFNSLNSKENVKDLIAIPQDSRNYNKINETFDTVEQRDDDTVAKLFDELPHL